MLRSHVIEIDGTFVGAAVQHADGYKFVAIAPQLGEINGTFSPSLQEARRLAVQTLRGLRPFAARGRTVPAETES